MPGSAIGSTAFSKIGAISGSIIGPIIIGLVYYNDIFTTTPKGGLSIFWNIVLGLCFIFALGLVGGFMIGGFLGAIIDNFIDTKKHQTYNTQYNQLPTENQYIQVPKEFSPSQVQVNNNRTVANSKQPEPKPVLLNLDDLHSLGKHFIEDGLVEYDDWEKQMNNYIENQNADPRAWGQVLKSVYKEETRRVNRSRINYWENLSGIEFEQEIGNLFEEEGYKVSFTPASGDEGVDIKLRKGDKFIIVQCKAHKDPVGANIARELGGAMFHFKADEAILVCIGGFTSGVHDYVKDKPIKLMKLKDIIAMRERLNKEKIK